MCFSLKRELLLLFSSQVRNLFHNRDSFGRPLHCTKKVAIEKNFGLVRSSEWTAILSDGEGTSDLAQTQKTIGRPLAPILSLIARPFVGCSVERKHLFSRHSEHNRRTFSLFLSYFVSNQAIRRFAPWIYLHRRGGGYHGYFHYGKRKEKELKHRAVSNDRSLRRSAADPRYRSAFSRDSPG